MADKADNLNLFCRVNVDSDLAHGDFVSLIARCARGPARMNSVRSDNLDISVDANDEFDATKSREGADRWLYFRYTLEIDPISGVVYRDYVAAIGALLTSLWSAGMDAVAACDFEDELPRSSRRLNWGTAPPSDRSQFQGGPDPLPAATHTDAAAVQDNL
jgi:hypothetical protein